MTPEQMEKAKKALREKKSEDLKKRILLHQYRQDMLNSKRWYLPFRMVHKREFPRGEIQPNMYYPHPCGIVIDGSGTPVPLPDAERITKATALFYFARLLAANEANLMQYRNSDWTGEAITTAEAAEIREEYLKRIRDYKERPERYDTEPHRIDRTGERYFLPPHEN